jgi:osmoprotectant transport system permease protein
MTTKTRRRLLLLTAGLISLIAVGGGLIALLRPAPIRIGSKNFTESVILGEMLTQLAQSTGQRAVHHADLGGTRILWAKLRAGSIDAYVDYTGTITQELLAGQNLPDDDAVRAALAVYGIRMSRPLGFNNTFALGMMNAKAGDVHNISDLRRDPNLRLGFTHEFIKRADGWDGLCARYGLQLPRPQGMVHEVALRALKAGALDVTDLYSTDAEIRTYGLRILKDDCDPPYFPKYEAVVLFRADLLERAPDVVAAMLRLEGKIDPETMIELNARTTVEKEAESRVAAAFLSQFGVARAVQEETVVDRLLTTTSEHLFLVGVSLVAAIAVAVPLGTWASKRPRIGQVILGGVGIIQTIPSVAILVFLIPLFGQASVGPGPVIVALFLYGLLPIVRNTYTGLRDIPPSLRESALALGLPAAAQLWLVELPLAAPSILAGIKTAAVITVGTATIGGLIGAGGYGQPFMMGLRLDSTSLILEGAIPAAVMALLVQWLFELAERRLVSKGLRLKPGA